jgi:hypothetical protein
MECGLHVIWIALLQLDAEQHPIHPGTTGNGRTVSLAEWRRILPPVGPITPGIASSLLQQVCEIAVVSSFDVAPLRPFTITAQRPSEAKAAEPLPLIVDRSDAVGGGEEKGSSAKRQPQQKEDPEVVIVGEERIEFPRRVRLVQVVGRPTAKTSAQAARPGAFVGEFLLEHVLEMLQKAAKGTVKIIGPIAGALLFSAPYAAGNNPHGPSDALIEELRNRDVVWFAHAENHFNEWNLHKQRQ